MDVCVCVNVCAHAQCVCVCIDVAMNAYTYTYIHYSRVLTLVYFGDRIVFLLFFGVYFSMYFIVVTTCEGH